jgi:DNA-3-methyladenine glycosylase I
MVKKNTVDQYDKRMVNLYKKVYRTLCTNSDYSTSELKKRFETYKYNENKKMSDNDYYKTLVDIIFFSGFKEVNIESCIEQTHKYLPDYRIVSNYTQDKINEIKNDPTMMLNKFKVDACIWNAKKIAELVKKYKSMKNYIESFNTDEDDEALYKLKRSLEGNFSYLGGVSTYQFMAEIGLDVLKPGKEVMRIFIRLGLVEDKKDLFGAVKVGRIISKNTNLPIGLIDEVFVLYGQPDQDKFLCICSDQNPRCDRCGVISECLYTRSDA